MTTPPSPPAPGAFQELAPEQAQRWIQSGEAVIVDVREPDEHAAEHIAGASLMPLSRFNPNDLAPLRGRKIIMQCRSGRRSADACRLAAGTGIGGLYNLTGGILAWKDRSLPVESGGKAPGLSVMRQVQLTIGAGVLGGAALAWLVHPAWIGLSAFFGAGLLFAGATGTCAMANLMAMAPWNRVTPRPGDASRDTCA
ncbi:Inner membrane protein YgaP [Phycisphaerales bacterium]|nr:Inner membrane protein YgaP [Phycisphaerales bacterium]